MNAQERAALEQVVDQMRRLADACAAMYQPGVNLAQVRVWANTLASLLTPSSLEQGDVKWREIATAPRDSTHVLVAYRDVHGKWRVMEGWWAIPYEDAPPEKGWWQTMTGVLLSSDLHDGLGATDWMPLPDPPASSPSVDGKEKE